MQQVMISNIMMQLGKSANELDLNMLKHMVLNSLRSYRVKFSAKYGELVIACESGSNWRKAIFPYYKANRKKDRDESKLDWNKIFQGLDEIRSDLREYFPYRVIQVEGAEADDIVGALCHHFGRDLPGGEDILIMSGDKDFKQLQTYMNVDQYDPVRKKKMTEQNPDNFLLEQIITGDRSDGVPNILSADNCLVLGERQGTMTAKRMTAFKEAARTDVWDNETSKRNFMRNEQMIDLSFTPDPLKAEILQQFEDQAGKTRSKIFNYLMMNKMKHLMESVSEF